MRCTTFSRSKTEKNMTIINELEKSLEAGSLDVAPSSLSQGAALQDAKIDAIFAVVCSDDSVLKLRGMLKEEKTDQTTVIFRRQNSWGQLGGSAMLESMVGEDTTPTLGVVTVPMAYYSKRFNLSDVMAKVKTAGGTKAAESFLIEGAARTLAQDIELDSFKGMDGFSNNGFFDGSIAALPSEMPGMVGLIQQVRQSDGEVSAKDITFSEYGADQSVALDVGATGQVSQDLVEEMIARRVFNNHSKAPTLVMDIDARKAYNKILLSSLQRFNMPGSVITSTGGTLATQETSNGPVKIETSRFLAGKVKPRPPAAKSPSVPTFALANLPAGTTATAGIWQYYVTAANEYGESLASPIVSSAAILAGDGISATITPGVGGVRAKVFHVYRARVNGVGNSASSMGFIGSVAANFSGTTTFVDLFRRVPAFGTAVMLDGSEATFRVLSGFATKELATIQLNKTVACYRWECLAVEKPRGVILCDNIASGKIG